MEELSISNTKELCVAAEVGYVVSLGSVYPVTELYFDKDTWKKPL